jgi:hypothetical protein
MNEKEVSGKILDTVWKLEKIAIDFHGKKILEKQFIKSFQDVLLELVGILIDLHIKKREVR